MNFGELMIHRPLLLTLFLLFGIAVFSAGQAIKVAVEMVSLPVVVTTREGKRVIDLKKEDFQVFEDGAIHEIAGFAATDEPISLALAIDTSGSTTQKLARMQNEAIRFVNQLHPDDEVAIMSFAEDVNLLTDFSINRDRNAYGIKETRSGGWTVIYEAVWLALQEVLKPKKERTALVLFTDGVDTASRKASQKETLELATESKATIYSIYFNTEGDLPPGYGPTVGGIPLPQTFPPVMRPYPSPGSQMESRAGREYLKKLAENSGGLVVDALDIQDLGPAFDEIARELSSQYSIGYYSTNAKHDGKFRKIEVKVVKPGLVARTKKGYYAPKDNDAKKNKK
jgi:Ca-activated chloride channel family protein